jgi:mRNA interferase MazF
MTMRRDKVGAPFGKLNAETMVSINRLLAVFLGFG